MKGKMRQLIKWGAAVFLVAVGLLAMAVPVMAVNPPGTWALSYLSGTGGYVNGAYGQYVPNGTSGSPVTAVANTGYRFVNWSDASIANPRTDYNVSQDITVTANFSDFWTITFESNGGSSISDYSREYNTSVSLPNPTKTGYGFAGWYSSGDSGPFYSITMPAQDITIHAHWTPVNYTITFAANGGTLGTPTSITQGYETNVTGPSDPTKTGYTFSGWYNDGSAYSFPLSMPGNNITLTASWTIITYTMTFADSSDGSTIDSGSYNYNSSVSLPSAPTRAGYSFAGWFTAQNGATSYTFPHTMVSASTAWAEWTINSYTISFNTGAGGSSVGDITQNYGTAVSAPAAPTRAHYTFNGWSPSMPSTMPAGGASLTASWTPIQYTITLNLNGGTGTTSIAGNYGDGVSAPTPTKTGYSFTSWSPSAPATMPDTSPTLSAQWTINQYTVTFNSNEGTVVAPKVQNYDTSVTAPSNPTKSHYIFAGWYDSGLSSAYSFPFNMPAYNQTAYAKWTPIEYTITFDSKGGSSVTAITQGYETHVDAPTPPTKLGYDFVNWYSDSALTEVYVFDTMPGAGATLYAKWALAYFTITFNSNGGSSVTEIYELYTAAMPARGNPTRATFTFDTWCTDAGLTATYELPATMPASSFTLYARWKSTITFNSNGGSEVTAIVRGSGLSVSAPSNPTRTGFTFDTWCSDSGLTSAYTFSTMSTENITLYARWMSTITFMSQGSSYSTTTRALGATVSAPETAPERTGYIFDKWCTVSALGTEYIFSTTLAGDLTLYARWKATITYMSQGSSFTTYTGVYGTGVTAPSPAPTRTGFTFDTWCVSEGGAVYTFATMPADNLTLYARWKSTITFVSQGSTFSTTTAALGATVSAPSPAPTREGYIFDKWCTVSALGTEYIFSTPLTGDLTLYARWTVTITLTLNGGTGASSIIQSPGTALTAPVPTWIGHTLAGWFTDSGLTSAYSFPSTMPDSNLTVYAKWTLNNYTFTFNSNAGSPVPPITQGYATTVYAPDPPIRVDYSFAGWFTDVDLTSAYTFTTVPANNVTLYAKWVWTLYRYTITFNSNGGTAVTAINQAYATTLTAPAAPTKTGAVFGGWYSNTALTTSFVFSTMPGSDMTLYAKWILNNYTLTYTAGANGTISGTTPQTVAYGASGSAVTAVPATGYHFVNWSDSSTANPRTDTSVSGNLSVSATFAAGTPTTTTSAPPTTTSAPPVTTTSAPPTTTSAPPVTITADDLQATLTIPGGITATNNGQSQPISGIYLRPLKQITEPPPIADNIIIASYEAGPSGTQFSSPITLVMHYDQSKLAEGVSESSLQVAYYSVSDSAWITIGGVVDTVNHTVTVQVPHFTTFAVISGKGATSDSNTAAVVIGVILAVIAIGVALFIFLIVIPKRRRRKLFSKA